MRRFVLGMLVAAVASGAAGNAQSRPHTAVSKHRATRVAHATTKPRTAPVRKFGVGPSPVFSLWGVKYPNMYYNDGSLLIPNTVLGGPKGAGSINASRMYINGVQSLPISKVDTPLSLSDSGELSVAGLSNGSGGGSCATTSANGNCLVDVNSLPAVTLAGVPSVSLYGTPAVTLSGNPNVNVGTPTVYLGGYKDPNNTPIPVVISAYADPNNSPIPVMVQNSPTVYAGGTAYSPTSQVKYSYAEGCIAISSVTYTFNNYQIFPCVHTLAGERLTAASVSSALNVNGPGPIQTNGPGRLVKIIPITVTTASGGGSCWDTTNAAGRSANTLIITVPTTAVVGTPIAVDMPVKNGVYCDPGSGGVWSISYN